MKHLMTFVLYFGVCYAVGGPLYLIIGAPPAVTYFTLLIVAAAATIYHYLRP
jgi:hypothetical protein